MPSVSKLIKIWAMQRFFASRTSIFQNLLTRLAAIAAIGIIISVLLAASIAGAIGFGYSEMLLHGVDRYIALNIVVAIIVFLLAGLGLAFWICLRKLKKQMRKLMFHQAPIASRINEVTNAFFEGLMGE